MSNKRRGQLTVSGEWAKHLRPFFRRAFWKGERQAAKDVASKEQDACPQSIQEIEAVENLLSRVASVPATGNGLELWVPHALTLKGVHVPLDVAMAVVLDKALSLGLEPEGYRSESGGRWYLYKLPSPKVPSDA
jgi:hypothetical protein